MPPEEGAAAETPELWIRFESHRRFHAVYLVMDGSFVTFCGRVCAGDKTRAATENPTVHCHGCLTRIKHPYLIPDTLRKLRRQKVRE